MENFEASQMEMGPNPDRELAKREYQLSALMIDVSHWKKTTALCQMKLESLKEDVEDLQQHNKLLSSEVALETSRAASLLEEKEALQKQLFTEQANLDASGRSYAALEVKMHSLVEELQAAAAETEALKQAVVDAKGATSAAEKAALEQQKQMREELESAIRKGEEELIAAKDEAGRKIASLQDDTQRALKVMEERTLLAEQLAAAAQERAALAEQAQKVCDERMNMSQDFSEERLRAADEKSTFLEQHLRQQLELSKDLLNTEKDARKNLESKAAAAESQFSMKAVELQQQIEALTQQVAEKDKRLKSLEEAGMRSQSADVSPRRVAEAMEAVENLVNQMEVPVAEPAAAGALGGPEAGAPPEPVVQQPGRAKKKAEGAPGGVAKPSSKQKKARPSKQPPKLAPLQEDADAEGVPAEPACPHQDLPGPAPREEAGQSKPDVGEGDAAGGRASRHRKPANAWWLPGGAPAPEQQNEAGSPSPQAASKSPTQSAAGSPAAPKAAKQVPVPVHAQVEPPEAVAMEIAEPGPAAPAVDSGEAAPEPVPAKAEKKRNRAKAAKGGPQPADEVDAEPAAKSPRLDSDATATASELPEGPPQATASAAEDPRRRRRDATRPAGISKIDLSTVWGAAPTPAGAAAPDAAQGAVPAVVPAEDTSSAGEAPPAAARTAAPAVPPPGKAAGKPSRLSMTSRAAAGGGNAAPAALAGAVAAEAVEPKAQEGAAAPASMAQPAAKPERNPLAAINARVLQAAAAREPSAGLAAKAMVRPSLGKNMDASHGDARPKRKLLRPNGAALSGYVDAVPSSILFGDSFKVPKLLKK